MRSIYISFEIEIKPKKKVSLLKRLFTKIIFFVIPNTNPDFESKIDFVKTWLLEFEDEDSVPINEIGLDIQNNIILKMPYKKNCGYWTDNLLKYKDFERLFNISRISQENFKELWKKFK
jgi:hypothetical protein